MFALEVHRRSVARRLKCEWTVEAEDRMTAAEVAGLDTANEQNRKAFGEALQSNDVRVWVPTEDAFRLSSAKLEEARKKQKSLVGAHDERVKLCEAETQ